MDEIAIYRTVGGAFLVGLPAAVTYIILPAKSLIRQRVRLMSIGFVSIGLCFIGFVSSWPGPNAVTSIMMLVGLIMFLGAICFLLRSFMSKKSI